MSEAVKVTVRGRVQGVGFRPFVYRLAREEGLTGSVRNNMAGVRIVWEGSSGAIQRALDRLRNEPPRLARIDELTVEPAEATGRNVFKIMESDRQGKSSLVIPTDAAVCDDCLREMRDPSDFRYRYPFINCTQCGPRYTIIDELPYDRTRTSMAAFQMCHRCAAEYSDPDNRRHHAQPVACDACGPYVSFLSDDGVCLAERDRAVRMAAASLDEGRIVAIKGIGGFHLACDAMQEESVRCLRQRKGRPHRPLAVMAASVEAARRIAEISDHEAKLLRSPEAPIVLLKKGGADGDRLPETLAPGLKTIGIMLPYTPLHHLLFDDGHFTCLVMTSANPSGLPILYQNDRAQRYVNGIADRILTHNRPILHAIDDSVVRAAPHAPFFLRRARGYVPDPITTRSQISGIVALGSQMKNTFAIGRGRQAFVGPHLGDLSNEESIAHYMETLHHLLKWAACDPEVVAVDRHPDYSTRRIADRMNRPIVDVQHHHAHLVSCLEENRVVGPCFGLILDGTGYGDDGNIWGFELLYGDASGYRRLAHLRETPLPGGDKAVLEPWRNATAMLIACFGDRGRQLAQRLFPDRAQAVGVIAQMCARKINSPLAGTCGRLFDAVSAILGLCETSTYDGEAAVLLSELPGDETVPECYRYSVTKQNGLWVLDPSPMLDAIVEERLIGKPAAEIAGRFQKTVVSACCTLIERCAADHPEFGRRIALSGGSMNNPYLSDSLTRSMEARGFTVYTHHLLPAGDGGLSFGQLMIAAQKRNGA